MRDTLVLKRPRSVHETAELGGYLLPFHTRLPRAKIGNCGLLADGADDAELS